MNKSEDLHGNVPDQFPIALLIIDMINDLEFPNGGRFLKPSVKAAKQIAALKQRSRDLNIPVIYINDNFGRWRSDFKEVVEHCLKDGVRGQPLAELLYPASDDYFVLKPKHSAFFATTLDTLLKYLNVKHLILTGISADICILFSAKDAYMREFGLSVPGDCLAADTTLHTKMALTYMERVLRADTTHSSKLDLESLSRNVLSAAG
ncbi:isochorismatase family cysteine hydrolase [Larkinella humicola]|uniref:Cysteine hydrolase n=1 Tax=Larkinella humicola TaxID=2607654 RepID=A0A5N1J9A3_9BACT|nr:isochorismatase family cysteine hydrolase [Larkinella humicola]KAA9349237.1 cysteine hydrolase [Larkinella humicola]